MIHPRPWTIAALVVALGAPAVPAAAASAAATSGGGDERFIRCESGRGRYQECPADTDNTVTLVREFSRNRCRQWNNWGYDRRAVWVDNGCRAEFRVGRRGGGNGAAVAVGAVAGVAIIAAIIAAKSKNDAHKDQASAPNWTRGSFSGFSPRHDADLDILVADDGDVTGRSGDHEVTGHMSANGRLHLGEYDFDLERQSWGFIARQRDDAESIIYFRRRN